MPPQHDILTLNCILYLYLIFYCVSDFFWYGACFLSISWIDFLMLKTSAPHHLDEVFRAEMQACY